MAGPRKEWRAQAHARRTGRYGLVAGAAGAALPSAGAAGSAGAGGSGVGAGSAGVGSVAGAGCATVSGVVVTGHARAVVGAAATAMATARATEGPRFRDQDITARRITRRAFSGRGKFRVAEGARGM